jgi:hypothetical protein
MNIRGLSRYSCWYFVLNRFWVLILVQMLAVLTGSSTNLVILKTHR